MYGKLFDSIYDGTLHGQWEAIVTMQQLVVLASPDGVVDMTPAAISARTSIPLDIIDKGLKVLAEPDPYSRTPGEDGRRIVLIDEHRPWGWRLVNHAKYMKLRNMDQKREADRVRIAGKRKKFNDVATVSHPSPSVAIASQDVANVAHSDLDIDTDSNTNRLGVDSQGFITKDLKPEKLSTSTTATPSPEALRALRNPAWLMNFGAAKLKARELHLPIDGKSHQELKNAIKAKLEQPAVQQRTPKFA